MAVRIHSIVPPATEPATTLDAPGNGRLAPGRRLAARGAVRFR